MKMLRKLGRISGLLLIACMFAVCMVLGVVPIVPKRKESFEIEIKMEQKEAEPVNATPLSRSTNLPG